MSIPFLNFFKKTTIFFKYAPFTKKGKVAIITPVEYQYAPVVQWIERQIPVLNVGGSSPFGRAKVNETRFSNNFFEKRVSSFREALQ